MFIAERCVAFSCVTARQIVETTPVQARFPIDAGGVGCIAVCLIGAASFWAMLASSGHGITRLDALRNQARAGTVPDQRRRLGMV